MITEIYRDELKQKLDHPKKSIPVEALPPEHFRKVHIPGGIHIPVDQIRSRASEPIPTKDSEVIVYCVGPSCPASRNKR